LLPNSFLMIWGLSEDRLPPKPNGLLSFSLWHGGFLWRYPIAGWFVSWKILRMKMDDLGVPPICANPAMGSLPSPWKMEPIFNLPLPAVAAQLPF
jgi:hypothetical protein